MPESRAQNFKWENFFLLDSLTKTLDPQLDATRIAELNVVPDSMNAKWIKPFSRSGAINNVMISYQYGISDVHVVLVGVVDNIYIDKSNKENSSTIIAQYLLTLKTNGDLIDGLKVQERLGKVDIGDEIVDDKAVWGRDKWSLFSKDTIHVLDKVMYQKDSILSQSEVHSNDTTNITSTYQVLALEFDSTEESFYVVASDGKIKKIATKKGPTIKTGETIEERVKP